MFAQTKTRRITRMLPCPLKVGLLKLALLETAKLVRMMDANSPLASAGSTDVGRPAPRKLHRLARSSGRQFMGCLIFGNPYLGVYSRIFS
jgi:hypothetical protein